MLAPVVVLFDLQVNRMAHSRAWLLGVALGALVAGAASAQNTAPVVYVAEGGSGLIVKSHFRDPTRQTQTTTVTVNTPISTESDLRKKINVLSIAWRGMRRCSKPKAEHYELTSRKTAYALIHTGTSMGTENGCGNTLFKFHDIYYMLATKHAVGLTDHFQASLIIPFYQGHEVRINFIFNVAIGQ